MSDESKYIIIVIVLFIVGIIAENKAHKTIESQKKITPEIRITIKDNQIDTVYIYRKP